MRTLLLHDIVDDGAIEADLRAAGHDVVRCAEPGAPSFPCRAVTDSCPLDATVDVAVVVHDKPTTGLAPGEAGVVCAIRDGIPLVVAGNGAHSPFREQADAIAPSVDDISAACGRAIEARQARVGRLVGEAVGVPASVHVDGDAVHVVLPEGTAEAVAVLAHQAARRSFPAARRIDVGTG